MDLVVVLAIAVGIDLIIRRLGRAGVDLGILVVAVLIRSVAVLVKVGATRAGFGGRDGRGWVRQDRQRIGIPLGLTTAARNPAFEVAGDDAQPPGVLSI